MAKVPQEHAEAGLNSSCGWPKKAGCSAEEHDHYLDLLHSRHDEEKRISALGRTIHPTAEPSIDPEDIFFLNPEEVRRAGVNPDQFNLRYIVDRREKPNGRNGRRTPNPPAILKEGFDLDQAMQSPGQVQ